MSYLKDWQKLKKDYEAEREKSIKMAKKAKMKVKKNKDSPDLEELEDLEKSLKAEIAVRRKSTGISPALVSYEQVLIAMEKLVKDKVSPKGNKAWKSQLKYLAATKTQIIKANKVFVKNLTEVKKFERDYTSRKYGRPLSKQERILGPAEFRTIVGKTKAADVLRKGLVDILEDCKQRELKIQMYYDENK